MYYLKPISSDITEGILYKLTDEAQDKILINKNFSFSTCDDLLIKGAIICQWIAEGQSLNLLDEDINGLPSKYEFFTWLENKPELKIIFEKAKMQRMASTVENLYDSVNKSNLSEDTSDKLTDSITKLSKSIANLDAAPKTIINTRVYVPPILRKWYKSPVIERELKKVSND